MFAAADAHAAAAQAALAAGREFWFQEEVAESLEALEFGRGQEALDPTPALELELVQTLASILVVTEDAGWEGYAERAVELARGLEEDELIARAMGTRVELNFRAERFGDVMRLAPEAIDVMLGFDRGGEAVGSLWMLAQAHAKTGDPAAASAVLHSYLARRGEFGEEGNRDLEQMGAELLRDLGRDDEAARWDVTFSA